MRLVGLKILAVAVVLASASIAALAEPLGTSFTYQGKLELSGIPMDGSADFQFSLWNDPVAGTSPNQIGPTLSLEDVPLDDGYFVVELDFGTGAFDGEARWLQMNVRPGDSTGRHTPLSPRQKLTATPYALYAVNVPETEQYWAASGNDIHNTNSGNVGIGTTAPESLLHLLSPGEINLVIEADTDNAGETDNARVVFRQDGGAITGRIGFASGENDLEIMQEINDSLILGTNNINRMEITRDGDVGIGTSNPQAKLTVATYRSDPIPMSSYLHLGGTAINAAGTFGDAAIHLNLDSTGRVSLGGGGGEVVIGPIPDEMIVLDQDDGVDGARITMKDEVGVETVMIDSDENVGGSGAVMEIRNGSGITTVELNGQEWSDAGVVEVNKGNGSFGASIYGEYLPYHGSTMLLRNAPANGGNATIYLEADRYGDGRGWIVADEISTGVVHITGGSDLSEQFDVTGKGGGVNPGMVVSIDPAAPGKLMVSREAYDKKVAGIVSGAGGLRAGLRMGKEDSLADGEYPVALTGRVFCLCDASNGPIEPGDLLTTSRVPGHAMKATDYGKTRGAVLGKAMTPLDEGSGLVLVLVTLQ